MISKNKAQAIVLTHINEADLHWEDKPEMVVTEVERHELGWLFSWTSRCYLETQNISDAITGNGPILVSETTGYFEEVGTAPPIEERVNEAATRLREKIKRASEGEPVSKRSETDGGKSDHRFWDSSAIPVSAGSSDGEGDIFPIGWVFLWGIIIALIGLGLWVIF